MTPDSSGFDLTPLREAVSAWWETHVDALDLGAAEELPLTLGRLLARAMLQTALARNTGKAYPFRWGEGRGRVRLSRRLDAEGALDRGTIKREAREGAPRVRQVAGRTQRARARPSWPPAGFPLLMRA